MRRQQVDANRSQTLVQNGRLSLRNASLLASREFYGHGYASEAVYDDENWLSTDEKINEIKYKMFFERLDVTFIFTHSEAVKMLTQQTRIY